MFSSRSCTTGHESTNHLVIGLEASESFKLSVNCKRSYQIQVGYLDINKSMHLTGGRHSLLNLFTSIRSGSIWITRLFSVYVVLMHSASFFAQLKIRNVWDYSAF